MPITTDHMEAAHARLSKGFPIKIHVEDFSPLELTRLGEAAAKSGASLTIYYGLEKSLQTLQHQMLSVGAKAVFLPEDSK